MYKPSINQVAGSKLIPTTASTLWIMFWVVLFLGIRIGMSLPVSP